MREAVIVAAKRTPIGKAYRGAFNNTHGATLGAAAITAAVAQAGIDLAEVEDLVMGCALQQGTTGRNLGRRVALRAGLPVSVSGMTIDRQCSSGLMAVASAAHQIVVDGAQVTIGAGMESISLVQNEHFNHYLTVDPWLAEHVPGLQCSMIETAEIVAARYGVSREVQDEYALQSQQRTALGQREGHFADEIVPVTTTMKVIDKATGEFSEKDVTLAADEGNRPQTRIEDLAALQPVFKGGEFISAGSYVTAGNASQLSDGAAAVVLMERREAEKRGIDVLGAYRGTAVAGCAPEEMGIGPVFAIPKLLARHGLNVDDIGLWEINEAFASQLVYCRDRLEIPNDRLNVSGGAISIGHPYGMTGVRCISHLMYEGRRRGVKYGVVAMCVGTGMGAAGLFEIY